MIGTHITLVFEELFKIEDVTIAAYEHFRKFESAAHALIAFKS